MKLVCLTTGGTIDGFDKDTGRTSETSGLANHLRKYPDAQIVDIRICHKDSRDIDETDRASILKVIEDKKEKFFIVGHGTYTICETGRFLKRRLASTEKTALLVGAWVPCEDAGSDAPEQINFALSSLESLQHGVFVCMDGKLWDPDTTEKRQLPSGDWTLISIK